MVRHAFANSTKEILRRYTFFTSRNKISESVFVNLHAERKLPVKTCVPLTYTSMLKGV